MVAFCRLSITPSTSKTFVHTSVSVGVLGHATHPSKNGCDAKDHFRQRILMINNSSVVQSCGVIVGSDSVDAMRDDNDEV